VSGLDFGKLAGKRILLCVTGSIAAYKSPNILRQLRGAGAEVKVLLTESAEKFVTRAVFSGLGAPVFTDMWGSEGEPHVELAAWAQLIALAPASADTLARMRQGRAEDLLTATLLCFKGPMLIAPAMHPAMWQNAATCENVAVLRGRGAVFVGPVHGEVASGEEGIGRMEEPEVIAHWIGKQLIEASGPLRGRRIIVTAGPTRESLDPVRAITNISSGKMGYAIAAAAVARGASVTLISGPVHLKPPTGVDCIFVESANQMKWAIEDALGPSQEGADVLIMSAAVSDYRPAEASSVKIKRGEGELTLQLKPNPDILKSVGTARIGLRPVLVGFALETLPDRELVFQARQKLIEKRVDLIVANRVAESLGRDESRVQLVSAQDCTALPSMSKASVAARLLDWVEKRLNSQQTNDTVP
jgi:phosphopantothenoylcysteine decarboxylase / phosphopantothenate---cysteine ligase